MVAWNQIASTVFISGAYRHSTQSSWVIVYITVAALVALSVFLIAYMVVSERKLKQRIDSLVYDDNWISADEFMKLRTTKSLSQRRGYYSSQREFVGIYVLHNVTKNKYYVGQARKVLARVADHLSGRGNGDVYADYKYGDEFFVNVVPLAGSGYESLDDMKRDAINRYDAVRHGYNRRRGNRR